MLTIFEKPYYFYGEATAPTYMNTHTNEAKLDRPSGSKGARITNLADSGNIPSN